MKIKFIKEHFSGIEKGRECEVSDEFALSMIDEGFAEEVKPVIKESKKKKKN